MKEINLPMTELLAGLAEECCELAQAALKLRRFYDGTNPTPISEEKAKEDFYEEIADVQLYMDQIPFPECYVDEIRSKKLERWKKRMEILEPLKEREEERVNIVHWLGKFCSHLDLKNECRSDEQNIEFFRKKMKEQFGWDVDQ